MQDTLISTFLTSARHIPTSTKEKVTITYWPWMRTMKLLEDARLGRGSWADAKFAYITDPRPYEDLLPHAPKMIRVSNTESATLATVSNIQSISYSPALTEGNETWPWEREMQLREDLRLGKKDVTWGQVRQLWLSESD